MSSQTPHILKSCISLIIILYGFWYVNTELLVNIIPTGLLCVGLLATGVYALRIPAPDPCAVEAVVGKDPSEESVPDGHYVMKSAAHRGAGLDAPENSLAAFKLCHEKGCSAIEFDLKLTADGIPVVFHDDTLERMSDSNAVISQVKWEELSKIDISVKHPFKDRFVNTKIPTLQETVVQLLNSGQRMFIDLKDNDSKMVPVVLNIFEQHPELHSKAVVSSFFPNLIYMIRRANPKIVCSLAWRPHSFAYSSYNATCGKGPKRAPEWYKHFALQCADHVHDWLLTRLTYYILGVSLILLHKDTISPKTVADWRNKGVRVVAWTVNHPVEKQYCARALKITYLTDTLTGESTAHAPPN